LENLTTVLSQIANDYDKKVMVGEISWAYTMEDGDNSGNSISADSAVTLPYSVTVQGQADCIRETTAALTSIGDAAIGILPEPNVTSVMLNNKDVRIALDLTKEWKKATDSDLVQGCIIVSAEFAEKYPTALKTFLEEYKASVDFANNSVDEAAQLIEAAGIVPKAAIAKKALPNCNIVLITGKEMKAPVEGMLKVLFDANPKSVGGKLPDEAFYYVG
jgi:NitT/TauT family transport system substrate-binding protein